MGEDPWFITFDDIFWVTIAGVLFTYLAKLKVGNLTCCWGACILQDLVDEEAIPPSVTPTPVMSRNTSSSGILTAQDVNNII